MAERGNRYEGQGRAASSGMDDVELKRPSRTSRSTGDSSAILTSIYRPGTLHLFLLIRPNWTCSMRAWCCERGALSVASTTALSNCVRWNQRRSPTS